MRILKFKEVNEHKKRCDLQIANLIEKGIKGKWGDEPHFSESVVEDEYGDSVFCTVLRNPNTLSLCGYVGVSKSHPAYGKHYDDIYSMGQTIGCHGGLTYSDSNILVSAVAKSGLWWFGFDCAHANDLIPSMLVHNLPTLNKGIYREFDDVVKNTKELAEQIIRIRDEGFKGYLSRLWRRFRYSMPWWG